MAGLARRSPSCPRRRRRSCSSSVPGSSVRPGPARRSTAPVRTDAVGAGAARVAGASVVEAAEAATRRRLLGVLAQRVASHLQRVDGRPRWRRWRPATHRPRSRTPRRRLRCRLTSARRRGGRGGGAALAGGRARPRGGAAGRCAVVASARPRGGGRAGRGGRRGGGWADSWGSGVFAVMVVSSGGGSAVPWTDGSGARQRSQRERSDCPNHVQETPPRSPSREVTSGEDDRPNELSLRRCR